jgi:rhodanese-related sulfurtransferase
MSSEPNPANVPQLAPAKLAERLGQNEPICLLDVREPAERAHCRVPSGTAADLHIPLRTVPENLDAIRDAAGGRTLVVYCHHGARSMMAARWLAAQGLGPVENLDGGIDAYSLQVDPGVPRYQ